MKLITQYRDRENVKYVTGVKFPARRKDSHKYNYGSDMVVGGSIGYTGAPIYAAEAASRAGAGLSFAAVPECVYQIEACRASSAMVFPAGSVYKSISIRERDHSFMSFQNKDTPVRSGI